MKSVLQFTSIVLLLSVGCLYIKRETKERIYVIQEMPLKKNISIYWFTIKNGSLSPGPGYFQITTNKCELSAQNANASSIAPVQIYNVSGDTVFVMTATDLVTLKESNIKIKAIEFSHELFDIKKKPKENSQYYVDSLCN